MNLRNFITGINVLKLLFPVYQNITFNLSVVGDNLDNLL